VFHKKLLNGCINILNYIEFVVPALDYHRALTRFQQFKWFDYIFGRDFTG
jgi:hypothetical protein